MGQLHNFKEYKFTPFKLRIGDLEVTNYFLDEKNRKKSAQSHLDIPKYSYFEVVKWQSNSYFERESEYELGAEGEFYSSPNSFGHKIHKSCFLGPETNFMIARWNNINHDELVPDLEFIGRRVFELSGEELTIFMNITRLGQIEIERQLLKNYEEHD